MGKEVRAIVDNKEIVFRKTKKTVSNGKEIETNQATLFAEIWQEDETISMPKEKRIHFKKPTYNKEYKNDTISQSEENAKVSEENLKTEKEGTITQKPEEDLNKEQKENATKEKEELTKVIKDDFATWTKLRTILSDLTAFALTVYKTEKYKANPFNYELNDEVFNIDQSILQTTIDILNILRVWKDFSEVDTNEQGANIWETEIIGSEDLLITERLYLHESLLNALKNGVELADAMEDIKLILNLLKKGYTLDDSKYVLATIKGKENVFN